MNFFAILKLIIQLLPVIHLAVDQIDDMFPASGHGAQKLALVKTILEKAIAISDVGEAFGKNPSWTFDSIWPMLSGIIANIVSTKKAVSERNPDMPNAQNVQPTLN
jgi:hypothetical protein